MKYLSFILAILTSWMIFVPKVFASDVDITIRHIDRTYAQGTVDIYRVKSWDGLKDVIIETNLGKYEIPVLGTGHSNGIQNIYVCYDGLDDPDLIIKKVTAVKDGKRRDFTKNVRKELFTPMKVIIRK